AVQKIRSTLAETALEPTEINEFLTEKESSPLSAKQRAAQILLRPGINLQDLIDNSPKLADLKAHEKENIEQAEIQLKYETYINKEKELVKKMNELENLKIPEQFNYEKLVSLSSEAKQKFIKIKPRTLGQASRISGVSPSDVQILMVYMGR